MFQRRCQTRPVITLLVVAASVVFLTLPATSASTGLPGIAHEHQASRGEESSPGKLLLIENAGQWPEDARFLVWGSPVGNGTTWLAEDAIWITIVEGRGSEVSGSEVRQLTGVALKVTFVGANPDARIEPLNPLTTTVSYFLGDDADQWHAAVPMYGGVRYAGLYPGVDLVLGEGGAFWQLKTGPGAEAAQVSIRVEGAEVVDVDGADLHLTTATDTMVLSLPVADIPLEVEALDPAGQSVSFHVQPADPQTKQDTTRAQLAPEDDPTDLLFSTFLGASGSDEAVAVAVDNAGRTTVAGITSSPDFPTTPGAFDTSCDATDCIDGFVARLSADGSALVYATYLGGLGYDIAQAVAVDDAGRTSVAGYTSARDFPTTAGAFDRSYNGGGSDAFVARLSADGRSLVLQHLPGWIPGG